MKFNGYARTLWRRWVPRRARPHVHRGALRLARASDWKPGRRVLNVEHSDEEVASLCMSRERLYGTAVAARDPSSRESIIASSSPPSGTAESITAACAVSDITRHQGAADAVRRPTSIFLSARCCSTVVADQRLDSARRHAA